MEVLKQIIRTKEDALSKHITIFSLAGIMAITLNNVISYNLGGYYGSYFGFAPSHEIEVYFDMVIWASIFVYFKGYFIDTINQNKDGLSELHLKSYITFLKFFPLLLYWTIICAGLYICLNQLTDNDLYIFALSAGTFLTAPWLNIIPILFGKKLKHEKEFYNPIYIIKCLGKNLFNIIKFGLQTTILFLIAIGFSTFILIRSNAVLYSNVSLMLRIFAISFTGYSAIILYCCYLKSLSKNFKY